MRELRIAWRNCQSRPVLSGVAALILGLGVSLAVCVVVLAGALEDGLIKASRPFDLLVGARGSPSQLVMSTILLQEEPVGNFSYDYFRQLAADPRVISAVPVALGDSALGAPLIGVGDELARLTDPGTGRPYFDLTAGRWFTPAEVQHGDRKTWEAVAGALAAEGLKLGTPFGSVHGMTYGAAHQVEFTLVGTLRPSNTPWDRAIFVPLPSYWEAHAGAVQAPALTAGLLRPVGIKEFYQLHLEINQAGNAQAVLTGQGMQDLFTRLDQGRSILAMISYLTLLMGAATVFLMAYTVGTQRRYDTAVLRALGASRRAVFLVGLLETLLIGVAGLILGLALGHFAAWLIGRAVLSASAIAIRPAFVSAEWLIVAAVLMLVTAAAVLPAVQAYRQDVVANLASS